MSKSSEEVQEFLHDNLIESMERDSGINFGLEEVESFEEAMLLTNDSGLVLTFDDGSEFCITIQIKKRPHK